MSDNDKAAEAGVKPELLAPAGSPAAGHAALQYGADAVYLGLKRFSARAGAENFSPEELRDFVGWAHTLSPRRRVYAAVNTLAQQRDLAELLSCLADLAECGADAVIVQDLGILELIRTRFPTLALHASTQMALHNRAGAAEAARLGVKRVTLARELDLASIRAIAALPGLEVETFLHGALCYGYSGLCLFSSLLTGRSANRGQCAYPCRGRFNLGGREGYAFSMKDLALAAHVRELRAAGVSSLKIEGRKKSPLYVAAAVRFYRGVIDGTFSPEEQERAESDLRLVFCRPATSFFIGNADRAAPLEPRFVGHLGDRIGTASGLTRRADGDALRFTPVHPLERHDGLQLLLPGEGEPYGFAVDDLRQRAGRGWKNVFAAEAGTEVEVGLPPDHPPLPERAELYHASSQRVKSSYPVETPRPGENAIRLPLAVTGELGPRQLRLCVTAATFWGARLEREVVFPGEFAPARKPGAAAEALHGAFARLGQTRFRLESLALTDPQGLFLPASAANAMRRDLMESLASAYAALREAWLAGRAAEIISPLRPRPAAAFAWSVKIDNPEILAAFTAADAENLAEIAVEISAPPLEKLEEGLAQLETRFGRERLRLALPVLCLEREQGELRRRLARLAAAGWNKWEIANLWGRAALREAGIAEPDLGADWQLYALNECALAQLAELGLRYCTLSPEDDGDNLRALLAAAGERLRLVVYQDTPLFAGEACPAASLAGGCRENCPAEEPVRDGFGREYLLTRRGCRTTLLLQTPLALAAEAKELLPHGLCHARADFLHRAYTPETAAELWRKLRRWENPERTQTGNFYRKLL